MIVYVRVVFCSDGKIFTVDAKVKRRNDNRLSITPMTSLGRSFRSAILGFVFSKDDVMPPRFHKNIETITMDAYLQIHKTALKSWPETLVFGRLYTFQQDSTPAHTSHLYRTGFPINVNATRSKEFWPFNSPELSSLDYYVSAVIKRVFRHPNVEILQVSNEAIFVVLHVLKRL